MDKKKNKNKKKVMSNYTMRSQVGKVAKEEVGFGFWAAQIREDTPGRGFVLQIDDPTFLIEGEEILLGKDDVGNGFDAGMGVDICEVKHTSKMAVSQAFKSSLCRLASNNKPNTPSMFQSQTLYYELEGRNNGLYYNEQMIVSFDDILRIFSKASEDFIKNFKP